MARERCRSWCGTVHGKKWGIESARVTREFICKFEELYGGSVGVSDEIVRSTRAAWEALGHVGVYWLE